MLRSVGKQSGECVESVLKKYSETAVGRICRRGRLLCCDVQWSRCWRSTVTLRWEGFAEEEGCCVVMYRHAVDHRTFHQLRVYAGNSHHRVPASLDQARSRPALCPQLLAWLRPLRL